MKPYQERLIAMLRDTITLLCRNGLEYEQEFSVEGLLGVTLDKNDVFLVPIKELITDKGAASQANAVESRVSDSDAEESNTSQVKSERSRKRRRHRRELTAEASQEKFEAVFESGAPEWDEDVSANVSNMGKQVSQDETPAKRPRPKQDPLENIKSEDVVVIKEELDEEGFSSVFQDNSMDSNAQGQDGQDGQMDFFAQPGTSQGQMAFPLDQLQGAVGSNIPGDLQNMSATGDSDTSWLQSPGGDMQQSQDWQQQKHQDVPSSPGTVQERFRCAHCDCCYTRRYRLKLHIQLKHPKPGDQLMDPGPQQDPKICHLCQKRFKSSSGLHYHLKAHENKFKYCCKTCGKGYNYKGDFEAHVNRHTGAKPFLCCQCGTRFLSKTSLVYHKKGCFVSDKPHICPTCQKSFKREKYLKTHMQLHAKPEQFQCTDCGSLFAHKSSLKKHVKNHHALGHNA